MGLGWSKDNLRTADKCYVNATYSNGTVKWPCGSINQREGTSGQFIMQQQQTILAVLSLGRAYCPSGSLSPHSMLRSPAIEPCLSSTASLQFPAAQLTLVALMYVGLCSGRDLGSADSEPT